MSVDDCAQFESYVNDNEASSTNSRGGIYVQTRGVVKVINASRLQPDENNEYEQLYRVSC